MKSGESSIYTALATLRNGQTQIQWSRIQMLLAFNTVSVPISIGSDQPIMLKLILSLIGLCVHIALVSSAIRGSAWIDYWGEKMAQLEHLDSDEFSQSQSRVKVFTDASFRSIHKDGMRLKKLFIRVGAAFGTLWFVETIRHLVEYF